MKSLRIAHLPHNVGNHAYILSSNEKKEGLCSICFVSETSYLNYPYDDRCWLYEGPIWRRELQKWVFLVKALFKFDVIHFNFGKKIFSTYSIQGFSWRELVGLKGLFALYSFIFQEFDLFLLKLFRKKIFVTFQGDDARQGEYCLRYFKTHFVTEVRGDYYTKRGDANKKKLISLFEKYSDEIFFLNPDLGWVLPKRAQFIPYLHVKPSEWAYLPIKKSQRLTFVHAPTHQMIKGSGYIAAAVARLQGEGFDFSFILVENKSFEEAKKIYHQADVVIDQLLAGWYGGLAVESMALGKPVVAYIRQDDLGFVPKQMAEDLPVIEADPESIYQVLKDILLGKYDLERISQKSRGFVEKWHDSEFISKEISSYYLK